MSGTIDKIRFQFSNKIILVTDIWYQAHVSGTCCGRLWDISKYRIVVQRLDIILYCDEICNLHPLNAFMGGHIIDLIISNKK